MEKINDEYEFIKSFEFLEISFIRSLNILSWLCLLLLNIMPRLSSTHIIAIIFSPFNNFVISKDYFVYYIFFIS